MNQKSLDKNKTKEPVDSKLNKTRSTGKSKELNSNYGESAINKPKELDWEKEFDKLNLGYDDSSIQCYFINGKGVDIVVKDFIKQTLIQQRTELENSFSKEKRELLEEIKKEVKDSFVKADKHKWNNESIQQWVLYKITNLLK